MRKALGTTGLGWWLRNGVAGATNTITQPLDVPQPLFFGGDNEGAAGENWRGMLDDIRIYDHALSATEVAALVPEPSSSVLLGIGLLPLLRRRRR